MKTADDVIKDEWPGGPVTRVQQKQRLGILRLVQGRRGEDSSARLRRRSTTCSRLTRTVISSAPSTQRRGSVRSMSGTSKLTEENAIKKTSEPIASPTTAPYENVAVPEASSRLRMGVTTVCISFANSWTMARGCNRETRCHTTRQSLNAMHTEG